MNVKIKYGDCSVCGGTVAAKRVEKAVSRGGRLIALVRDVPAGVCRQCGERYFKANVVKQLEIMLPQVKRASKTISVPVARYAA